MLIVTYSLTAELGWGICNDSIWLRRTVGMIESVLGAGLWQNYRKLLATVPGDYIGGPAQPGGKGLGDLAQAMVAVLMAECIVDGLEEIDVGKHRRDRPVAAIRPPPLGIQDLVEPAPIGNARQTVNRRPTGQLGVGLLELSVGLLQLAGPLFDNAVGLDQTLVDTGQIYSTSHLIGEAAKDGLHIR